MRRFIARVKFFSVFIYVSSHEGIREADERLDAFLASAEDEGEWLEKETMVPIDEKVGWIHRRSGRFEVKKILYPCRNWNVGS